MDSWKVLETVSKILYSFNSYIKVIERSLTDFNLEGKNKVLFKRSFNKDSWSLTLTRDTSTPA